MYGSWTKNAVLNEYFFQDSFKTYQMFLWCIFVQLERKFNLKHPQGLSTFEGGFWESVCFKLSNDDHAKGNKIS